MSIIIVFEYNYTHNEIKEGCYISKIQTIWDQLGENITLARKRRKLTATQLAERAAIERATLRKIERGDPGVSMGACFNILKALNLQEDFLKLAVDDELGRKLQDLDLLK